MTRLLFSCLAVATSACVLGAAVGTAAVGTAAAGTAASAGSPALLHYGQVTRQDVPTAPTSEADTVVEPDVGVSPRNADVAVAAAHDSRFANGGAVGITYAWTHDGGKSWQHRPVPKLTTATGGRFDRASDPVVAFGPDGTAYLSTLLINVHGCRSAVAVSRSTDAGVTFAAPVLVQQSGSCSYSDDKNWLVVDNGAASPHRGRLYQFWTPFIETKTYASSPQAVRFSDDHGRTWSKTYYVSGVRHGTQNSQPMILADGTLVDTFYDFGTGTQAPHPDVVGRGDSPGAAPSVVDPSGPIYAARSRDGGKTWVEDAEVTNAGGGYAPGVRCCLFGADVDATTGRMYVVYNGGGGGGNTDPVELSSSVDGRYWSAPVRVSTGDVAGVQRVNVDVVARGGRVYVSYGTRTRPRDDGGVVEQQLSVSTNHGLSFHAPISIGPVSVLKYAARAGGYFPGDYIGSAITAGRIFLVWARSSRPTSSTSPYHQVIVGATLRP
ncbi:MAG: sialidase family protein [Mycobacteriales bacterium]|nr:MAG: hypothetical protein DLM56_15365 [Pseudonocardiales bacterium]